MPQYIEMIDQAYEDGWKIAERNEPFRYNVYKHPNNQIAYEMGYKDAAGTKELAGIETDE